MVVGDKVKVGNNLVSEDGSPYIGDVKPNMTGIIKSVYRRSGIVDGWDCDVYINEVKEVLGFKFTELILISPQLLFKWK